LIGKFYDYLLIFFFLSSVALVFYMVIPIVYLVIPMFYDEVIIGFGKHWVDMLGL